MESVQYAINATQLSNECMEDKYVSPVCLIQDSHYNYRQPLIISNPNEIQNSQELDGSQLIDEQSIQRNPNECLHKNIIISTSKFKIFFLICGFFCIIATLCSLVFILVLYCLSMCINKCDTRIVCAKDDEEIMSYNEYIRYYNLDKIQIAEDAVIHQVKKEIIIDICEIKMIKPHFFETKCWDCEKVFEKGTRHGGLLKSIIFFIVFVSLFFGLIFIIKRYA